MPHSEGLKKECPIYASIIIPVYNEEDNLSELYAEIAKAMQKVEEDGYTWEVLFVDDGSTDKSLVRLRELSAAQPPVRYISFMENKGQSAAFAAGFKEMRGECAITLDADLQNDPADIPVMLKLFSEGYDLVAGWRAKRQDVWAKRVASKIANRVRNCLSHESIRDTGCSLKIMRASMLREIPMFTGMHRFFPTLMRIQGAARIVEIEVNHRPRLHGQSKYGILDRAFSAFYDLLAVRWMLSRHFKYVVREKSEK